MSLLLLKLLGSSYHSQCPALLLRPPGFRRSSFSPLRRAPHPCCSASGAPPPPSPPSHLLLLPSRPLSLLFSKERRPSLFPWLPVRHQQNTPPGISLQRFSTLAWCLPLPLVSCGPGSGSGGALLMERSSRERPPPYKRWRSTGENKGEGKGDCTAARAAEGRKAAETRPGREHGGPDGEASTPRSKSWSSDPGGDRRRSENHQKGERREESKGKGNRKKRHWEGGVGQGQTHLRMERPPPPQPPHTVDHKPNPWLLAGAPQRTYPLPPGWKNPGPPPPPGLLRNAQPPPVTSKDPPPPPPSRKAPPATGAWGNAPSATLRNPTSPPPGTFGNPEDFPPLSRSGPPPQRTQSREMSAQPLQRHWEDSPAHHTDPQPPGADCRASGFDFSVMSYNILSQDLLHDNAYLYRHCDPGVLPWDFRLPNLLCEIRLYHADVLCLQEVQEDHYEAQMKPALETLGYQCVYKKRTGKKPEGCAIAFKSSRLSLVSAHPLEYLRPGDALLDRDNVGLVLLLRPSDGGGAGQSDPSDFICVANTHLLYNPRRGDIKLAQLAILLAEISRLSRLPDGSANPVLVCGDFNSTPGSPLYRFLTQGCLEFKGLPIGMVSGQEDGRGQRVLTAPIWSKSLGINQDCCYDNQPASQPLSTSPTEVEGAVSTLTVEQLAASALASYSRTRLRHSVGLQSSYSHLLMPDGRAEITTCHSRTAMTVDYILYTPDAQTSRSLPGGRGLQLLARLSLVGQSELKAVNGLPNQHHSSDHLPILARFRLRR